MHHELNLHWSVLGSLSIALAGCGSAAAPTTSTITGHVDRQTFKSAVSSITIHGERGDKTVAVDAAGRFELVLDKGATYQFLLSDAGKDVPMVIQASATRLDTTVHVKSGGARYEIGAVRFWAGAAAPDASAAAPVSAAAPPVSAVDAPGTCDDAEDAETDDGDHPCEDGIDPKTGAACDGGPGANQDDGETDDDGVEATDCAPTDPMALPEFNIPGEIGCGDGDGEEADD